MCYEFPTVKLFKLGIGGGGGGNDEITTKRGNVKPLTERIFVSVLEVCCLNSTTPTLDFFLKNVSNEFNRFSSELQNPNRFNQLL